MKWTQSSSLRVAFSKVKEGNELPMHRVGDSEQNQTRAVRAKKTGSELLKKTGFRITHQVSVRNSGCLFKIKACEKNYRRQMFDIMRIILDSNVVIAQ